MENKLFSIKKDDTADEESGETEVTPTPGILLG